jgi:hypothetical protein
VVPRPLGIVYRTYTVLRAADRLQRGAARAAARLPRAVINAGIDATKVCGADSCINFVVVSFTQKSHVISIISIYDRDSFRRQLL